MKFWPFLTRFFQNFAFFAKKLADLHSTFSKIAKMAKNAKNGHFWAKIGDFWAKIAKMGPVPIEHWCRLVNSVVLHCDVTTNQSIYLVQQSFKR